MKKLLLILLLIPLVAAGQDSTWYSRHDDLHKAIESAQGLALQKGSISEFDITQDESSYFYVVQTTSGIQIVRSQVYDLGFGYADTTFTVEQNPVLKDVFWVLERHESDTAHVLTIQGKSVSDSLYFEFAFGDDIRGAMIEADSSFSESVLTTYLDTAIVKARAWKGDYSASWSQPVPIGMLDTLGGQKSIKKKEPMSQYFTDFSGYSIGDITTQGWSEPWSSFATAAIEDDNGTNVLRLTAGASDARRALTWDAVDGDAGRDDVEILMLVESLSTASAREARLATRVSGSAGSETGWTMGQQLDDNHRISNYDGGTFNNTTNTAFTFSANTLYWVRVRSNGQTHQSKIWADGDSEPASWTLEATNQTAVTGVGGAGFFQFDLEADVYIHQVGVGTNGDEAPASDPTVTLTPDSLSHNHTLESPIFELNYGLAPNSLQHSHALESPTFLSKYTLSANSLQHAHSLESPLFNATYTLSANGLQHGHTLQQSTLAVAFTLQANGMSHPHALEQPTFNVNYGLAPNPLQHGHTLESPTAIPAYVFSPNGLSHSHTLESTAINALYSLSANGLTHNHVLDSPTTTPSYVFSPNGLSHGHTLENTGLSVLYILTANRLQHGHSLDSPETTPAYVFSPNGLSHNHTLASTDISILYSLQTNGLRHGHTLDSPITIPGYTFSPQGLQHAHTLDSTSISEAILLAPDNLTHGHSLEAPQVDVSYLLSASDLNHSHTIETASLAVAYGLSPQGLSHSHALDPSMIGVNYLIAPEDLLHAHSLEQAGLVPHYLFTPEDLQHNHTLEQAVLQAIGEATKLQLSANELYAINLQAKKLYKVQLATIEDTQDLKAKDLYTITTNAKPKYIITLNANEKID